MIVVSTDPHATSYLLPSTEVTRRTVDLLSKPHLPQRFAM
jgi:hypothetical protein